MKKEENKPAGKKGFSRRNFLRGTGLTAAGMVVGTKGFAGEFAPAAAPVYGPDEVPVTLSVNDGSYQTLARPDEVLVDTLRERLDLTGTKLVCGRGACSACTVMVDDKPVCSCLTLTMEVQDKKITTIEGVADGDELHPIQQAFIDEDASMCGFCTPGMIMSCKSLLDRNSNPSLDEVKKAVRGNLCRCGTYPHVFKATLKAAERMG